MCVCVCVQRARAQIPCVCVFAYKNQLLLWRIQRTFVSNVSIFICTGYMLMSVFVCVYRNVLCIYSVMSSPFLCSFAHKDSQFFECVRVCVFSAMTSYLSFSNNIRKYARLSRVSRFTHGAELFLFNRHPSTPPTAVFTYATGLYVVCPVCKLEEWK